MRRHLAAILAGLALATLSGCGNDSSPGTPVVPTGGGDTPKQEQPKDDAPVGDLKKDVKVVACEGGTGVKATLEVTNSMKKPWEYYGTIKFLDGSGAELTEGLFNTGTLQPGQTAKEEIPGANVYNKVPKVTCEVSEVKLDEPE
jgi:hypothetical protein